MELCLSCVALQQSTKQNSRKEAHNSQKERNMNGPVFQLCDRI